MLDLIGLIFTLVKAFVQASIYATLLFALARLRSRFAPNSWLAKSSSNGKQFWWRSVFAASTALFLLANTPWGNHGLGGDYARIPLGHGLAMEEINGHTAYFEPVSITEQSEVISEIVSYQVSDDLLCARMNGNRFFTYNLATKHYQPFTDSISYNSVAKNLGLPTTTQFESFNKHYIRYWKGWRFWLLA